MNLDDMVNEFNVLPWKQINGYSLWLKMNKVKNDMDSITTNLGTMRIRAKSGPRMFTIPVAFDDNSKLWRDLSLSEKEIYNSKALEMKVGLNPIMNDELARPSWTKYDQECIKAKRFVEKKVKSMMQGKPKNVDRYTHLYHTGDRLCLDGVYWIQIPFNTLFFNSIFRCRLNGDLDIINETRNMISIELQSMSRALEFFDLLKHVEVDVVGTYPCPKVFLSKVEDDNLICAVGYCIDVVGSDLEIVVPTNVRLSGSFCNPLLPGCCLPNHMWQIIEVENVQVKVYKNSFQLMVCSHGLCLKHDSNGTAIYLSSKST